MNQNKKRNKKKVSDIKRMSMPQMQSFNEQVISMTPQLPKKLKDEASFERSSSEETKSEKQPVKKEKDSILKKKHVPNLTINTGDVHKHGADIRVDASKEIMIIESTSREMNSQ